MITKRLDSDSIKLPAIGQGLGDYSWNDQQINLIRIGIDLGMNYIDTSENYDKGRSELIIGKAIENREDVIIGTKFSPENNSHENVLKAAEGSLKRLKTDYIDIYQLHWPNPSIPLKETMSAMEALVDDGKVRYIGVCNLSLKEFIKAQSFINKKIVSFQVEYNLFDRSIEKDILPFCEKNKILLIAYSPLDQGRIADGFARRQFLDQLSIKYKRSPAQITLRWLINKPSVVVIPKTKSINRIKENAESSDFNLDNKDIEKIDHIFKRDCIYVLPNKIRVSNQGERNRLVYTNIEEAKENSLCYVPSPLDLSKSIKETDNIKPVRLIKTLDSTGRYKYDLIEGRIRYWAWIIAKGNMPIPAIIREDWYK